MFELLHRHVIHARRSVVRLHPREGSPPIRQRVDLVHQAEPLASQHSLFESCQHPFRPDLGFDPSPAGSNLSGRLSPFSGHDVRELLRAVRHVSTFLRSLRSRPVTAFPRYYGRSDSCPCRRASARPCAGGQPFVSFTVQVSLIHSPDLPALPSPTTCGSPGRRRTPWRHEPDTLSFFRRAGLRHSLAGSPYHAGRIEFVILRTGRSPPAALHLASRRRSCRPVTVWRWIVLERTLTSRIRCALRRTRGRARFQPCGFSISLRAFTSSKIRGDKNRGAESEPSATSLHRSGPEPLIEDPQF
jgi:hypothetical protein